MSEEFDVTADLKLNGVRQAQADVKALNAGLGKTERALAKMARWRFAAGQQGKVPGAPGGAARGAAGATSGGGRGLADILGAAAGKVQSLQAATSATSMSTWGLVTALGAAAAAYGALNLGVGVVSNLAMSTARYTSELEQTRIGLASVFQALEGGTFEQATEEAGRAFDRIAEASVKSPASAKQMFDIFTAIVGPIRGAGESMERVHDMTAQTVLAASALGVDFAQASRDINMMARGSAGMDVKLFSMLRSTRAIKESAEEFNAMDPAKRIAVISAALQKFSGSGDAFGKSWVGVTSTFQGVVQEAGRAAATPVLGTLAKHLGRVNEQLIGHQATFRGLFEAIGYGLSLSLDTVLTKLETFGPQVLAFVDRASAEIGNAFHVGYIWAGKASKLIMSAAEYLSGAYKSGALGKTAKRAAVGFGVTSLARPALGIGMGVAGLGLQGASVAASSGLLGGGGAAAGGAAAGGGLLAALASGPGILVLAGAIGTLAAGAAAAAGVVLVLGEYWDEITNSLSIVTATGRDFWVELDNLGVALADAVLPLLRTFGRAVLYQIVSTLEAAIPFAKLFLSALTRQLEIFSQLSMTIENVLAPAFDSLFGSLDKTASASASFADNLGSVMNAMGLLSKNYGKQDEGYDPNRPIKQIAQYLDGVAAADKPRTPGGRKPPANVKVSGNHITIKQDFKGQKDPDRIVRLMMDDMSRQAEQRLTSMLVPVLSR